MLNVEKTGVSKEDLAAINRFSRVELSAEDVYSFKMVCCDTNVDRDGEAFSVNALNKLAELYIGKTVITDHAPRAGNQVARIYKTEVTDNNGVSQLLAWAYIPKNSGNDDFIKLIETGIVKEVSVGCSVRKCTCSICGKELKSCLHKKFKEYDGKPCYGILDDVTDAYEVSFVAVPAQKEAGVTKQCAMYNVQCAMDKAAEIQIRLAESFVFCTENFCECGE